MLLLALHMTIIEAWGCERRDRHEAGYMEVLQALVLAAMRQLEQVPRAQSPALCPSRPPAPERPPTAVPAQRYHAGPRPHTSHAAHVDPTWTPVEAWQGGGPRDDARACAWLPPPIPVSAPEGGRGSAVTQGRAGLSHVGARDGSRGEQDNREFLLAMAAELEAGLAQLAHIKDSFGLHGVGNPVAKSGHVHAGQTSRPSTAPGTQRPTIARSAGGARMIQQGLSAEPPHLLRPQDDGVRKPGSVIRSSRVPNLGDVEARRVSSGSADGSGDCLGLRDSARGDPRNPIATLGRQQKPTHVWAHASLQQCLARPESRKGGHLRAVTRGPQGHGGGPVSEAQPLVEGDGFASEEGWEASSESEPGKQQRGFQDELEPREHDFSDGCETRDRGCSAGGPTAAFRERTRRRLEVLAGRRKDTPVVETADRTSAGPIDSTNKCGTQGGAPGTAHGRVGPSGPAPNEFPARGHLELGQRHVPRYRMGAPEGPSGDSCEPGGLQAISTSLEPAASAGADKDASRRPSRDPQTDRQSEIFAQAAHDGEAPVHEGVRDPGLGEGSHVTCAESAGHAPDPPIALCGEGTSCTGLLEEARVAGSTGRSSLQWNGSVTSTPRPPLPRQDSQTRGVAHAHAPPDNTPAHGPDESRAWSTEHSAASEHNFEQSDGQPCLDVPALVTYTHEVYSSEEGTAWGEVGDGNPGSRTRVLLAPELERTTGKSEALPDDDGLFVIQERVDEGHPPPQTVHLSTEMLNVEGSSWDASEPAHEGKSRGSGPLQHGPLPSHRRSSSYSAATPSDFAVSTHVDGWQSEKKWPSESGSHKGPHVTGGAPQNEGLQKPLRQEESALENPMCQVRIRNADSVASEDDAGPDGWCHDQRDTEIKAGEAVAGANMAPSEYSQDRATSLTDNNTSTILTIGSSSGEGFGRAVSWLG